MLKGVSGCHRSVRARITLSPPPRGGTRESLPSNDDDLQPSPSTRRLAPPISLPDPQHNFSLFPSLYLSQLTMGQPWLPRLLASPQSPGADASVLLPTHSRVLLRYPWQGLRSHRCRLDSGPVECVGRL